MKNARTVILALYLQTKKNWDDCYKAIHDKTEILPKYLRIADLKGKEYCVMLDDTYPERLKKSYKPSFAFKYRGDLTTLTNNHILILNTKAFKLKKHAYCYIDSVRTTTDNKFEIKFSDADVVITVMSLEEAIKVAAAYSRAVLIDKSITDDVLLTITVYFKPFEAFVRPTVKSSKANTLIKSGARLYDCEGDLDEN